MDFESWIEGPRWNDTETWIMKTAIRLNLKCSTNVKKGILRKTVFYRLEGDSENILLFKKEIGKLVSSVNGTRS